MRLEIFRAMKIKVMLEIFIAVKIKVMLILQNSGILPYHYTVSS
jgi:hypothetical protein